MEIRDAQGCPAGRLTTGRRRHAVRYATEYFIAIRTNIYPALLLKSFPSGQVGFFFVRILPSSNVGNGSRIFLYISVYLYIYTHTATRLHASKRKRLPPSTRVVAPITDHDDIEDSTKNKQTVFDFELERFIEINSPQRRWHVASLATACRVLRYRWTRGPGKEVFIVCVTSGSFAHSETR